MNATDIASCSAGIGHIKLMIIAAIKTKHPAAMKPRKKEKSFLEANTQPDNPKKIKAVPPSAVSTISLPDWLESNKPISGPTP